MNPLVSEMLTTRAGQDVELRFLEDLLNDDCTCEDRHRYVRQCSKNATYYVSSCQESFNTCSNSVVLPGGILSRMYRGDLCAGCDERASDCWEIRPI